MNGIHIRPMLILLSLFSTMPCRADIRGWEQLEITEYYSDVDDWLNDVLSVTVIEFTYFPHGTFIDDQYADEGVIFTNGSSTISNIPSAFVDDFGLDANQDAMTFDLAQPAYSLGVLFPGTLRFVLYLDGELVGWTETLGGASPQQFVGVILPTGFDSVSLIDLNEPEIDNLYFSFAEIPAPAAAVPLLALAAIAGRGRRRRSGEA